MAITVNKPALFAADRGHLLTKLATFSGKTPQNWSTAALPARLGTMPNKWTQVAGYPASMFVDAIAVAAPNHCIDGWAYCARATSAFLAGDLHATRHLAYYAQLRAAMSILGALGIGLFNGLNYAIRPDGTAVRIDTGTGDSGLRTHVAVWDVLAAWVSEPAPSRIFLDMVRIGGSTLSTCLDAIWPGASTAATATNMVEAWGFDLRKGKVDHSARNQSSYDPQALAPQVDNPASRLTFVEGVWRLLEPTSTTSFDLLDRHLLKAMLQHQHQIISPGDQPNTGAISRRYQQLPAAVQAIASQQFLTDDSGATTPELLAQAKMMAAKPSAVEMLSRAYLLLRTATAFTISNFHDAGIRLGTGQLRAWLDPIAVTRGFWPATAPLGNPSDMWEDVRAALDDLSNSCNPAPASLNDWLVTTNNGLPVIGEVERVGIWSLGA